MSKAEIQLVTAEKWAQECMDKLRPFCTSIMIAGSIRRKQPLVGDIELVVNLDRKMVSPFANALYNNFGFGMKRDSRYVKVFYERIQVDIFIPQQNDLIRQTVIRTGSAEFVYQKIAKAWVRLGWVGTEDGLRRRSECEEIRVKAASGTFKSKWVCKSTGSNISKPPHFETEEQLFGFLGLPWTPPENRI